MEKEINESNHNRVTGINANLTMASQYSLRSPAVKRILREAQEMAQTHDAIHAKPLEDNIFEWHFTIQGPPDSEYEHGIYHGRIILPPEYPMKPPSIIMLTPSGRFETGTKICLSISAYHPETWRPSWSIRTALVALVSFMTTPSPGAIGSIELTPEQRRSLARKSLVWECPECGPTLTLIKYDTRSEQPMNNGGSTAAAVNSSTNPADPEVVRVSSMQNDDQQLINRRPAIPKGDNVAENKSSNAHSPGAASVLNVPKAGEAVPKSGQRSTVVQPIQRSWGIWEVSIFMIVIFIICLLLRRGFMVFVDL